VAWNKIFLRKEARGLGFKCMRTLNKAYFAKLAWNLVTTIDKLWVQVKRETYNCGSFLKFGKL
jgi:hypothetical protein